MVKKIFMAAFCFLITASTFSTVWGHCEIPCGIYHDKTRIDLLKEHVETIEKSMNEITRLSQQISSGENNSVQNRHQLARWITNKENHADYLQEVVYQYFMTQRIIPVGKESPQYESYIKKLTLLHEMLVYAMKAKQTTDLSNVEKLKILIDEFDKAYFDKKDG